MTIMYSLFQATDPETRLVEKIDGRALEVKVKAKAKAKK